MHSIVLRNPLGLRFFFGTWMYLVKHIDVLQRFYFPFLKKFWFHTFVTERNITIMDLKSTLLLIPFETLGFFVVFYSFWRHLQQKKGINKTEKRESTIKNSICLYFSNAYNTLRLVDYYFFIIWTIFIVVFVD